MLFEHFVCEQDDYTFSLWLTLLCLPLAYQGSQWFQSTWSHTAWCSQFTSNLSVSHRISGHWLAHRCYGVIFVWAHYILSGSTSCWAVSLVPIVGPHIVHFSDTGLSPLVSPSLFRLFLSSGCHYLASSLLALIHCLIPQPFSLSDLFHNVTPRVTWTHFLFLCTEETAHVPYENLMKLSPLLPPSNRLTGASAVRKSWGNGLA